MITEIKKLLEGISEGNDDKINKYGKKFAKIIEKEDPSSAKKLLVILEERNSYNIKEHS